MGRELLIASAPRHVPRAARVALSVVDERGRWGIRWKRDDRTIFPYRRDGYVVTKGRPNLPWGRSIQTKAYLTHVIDELLIVWHGNTFLAARVRWRCGARTWTFRMLEEPDSPTCALCLIDRAPRPWERS